MRLVICGCPAVNLAKCEATGVSQLLVSTGLCVIIVKGSIIMPISANRSYFIAIYHLPSLLQLYKLGNGV